MKEKLKNILLKVSKSPLVDEGELLQAYRLVINSLQEALNIKRAGIWFVEHDYSSISCQLLIDTYHNTEIEEFVIDSDDYPHYFTALKAERAILAHDAHTNTATHEFIDRYLKPLNISSMLDVPIRHKGKMIGIVCCEHIGEKRKWNEDEATFAGSMADLIGRAINAHAFKESENKLKTINDSLEYLIKDRTAELRALNEIGKELNASLDIHNIFNCLYEHSSKIVDTHVFAIGILDNDKSAINFSLSIEADEMLLHHVEYLKDKTKLSSLCINQQEEIIIEQSKDIKLFIPNIIRPIVGEKMESIVYIPLYQNTDQVIGCLTIQSPNPFAYSPEQLNIIRTLTSYTAIAIDNATSYQEIENKNKEIIATQKQLVQSRKMASIGTMTAGFSQEINNPTNFSHAAAYMMHDEILKIKAFLKQLAGGDKAEPEVLQSFDEQFTKLIELTKTTYEGTKRIKNIVEDLRTFARIDDAKQAKVKVGDLINSTVHLVQTQYDSVVIETQLDYEPLITCFPSKLNQVFMNIIINACQAIESKKASISKVDGKFIIKTTQQDNRLIISFEDNGCGMTEQTLNRIFEPFYTTKDVGRGTGLGMAITFGIIDEHGGSIDVESVVDKGSKITIGFDV